MKYADAKETRTARLATENQKPMKLQNLFVLATILAASTWAFSAHAQTWVPPEIVLTETSDTSLTATINGSSLNVVDIGPDNWFVYGFGSFLIHGGAQWSDPNISGDVNTVGSSLFSTLGLGLVVDSDIAAGLGAQLANDTKDTTDFTYLGDSGLPVNVTFNDLGGSTVPDAPTTMPLLGVAAGALFGLARRVRK